MSHEDALINLEGAKRLLRGATITINRKDVHADEVEGQYNTIGDAINGATTAYLKVLGKVTDTPGEQRNAVRELKDVYTAFVRGGLKPLPDYDDMVTIIRARNGSIHQGVASATAVEAAKAAAAVAQKWIDVVERAVTKGAR